MKPATPLGDTRPSEPSPDRLANDSANPQCFGPAGPYGTLASFKGSLNELIRRRKLQARRARLVLGLTWCCLAPTAWSQTASWYGEAHRGLPMANGRPFNPDRLTAASWFYPLGTWLEVRHGGKSVRVQVTDRGPARRLVRQGRVIDLSRAAFARLAPTRVGLIAPVQVKPL